MYQRKSGEGSLFKNGYKQKETHPDWRGDFLGLDGQEYEIAGWTKSTRAGEPWYSLKIQPKRAKPDDRRPERGQPVAASAAPEFDDDKDLPF